MRIRRLDRADVDAAVDLSTQVGWNQLRADWVRLVELYPDGCYAGIVDGELVATTTVATYADRASWIGMVLVDDDHRRQGYGTTMFEHALAETGGQEPEILGLDATDSGRPLYRRANFVDAARIGRWCGVLTAVESQADVDELEACPDAVHALDRRVCGVDRSRLLDRLLGEPGSAGFVRVDEGAVRGYAIVRPGRNHWQVGPVVGVRREDAAHLFDAVANHLGDESVIVDAVRTDDTDDLLSAHGLTVQRTLSRMRYERADLPLWDDGLWAAAGLELG